MAIFVITEMIGELIQTKDYSTKMHQMQVANQNTYFSKKDLEGMTLKRLRIMLE